MKLIRPQPIKDEGSFTRASTGTYYNADGIIATAAINEPRFNYNPLDLDAPPVLLLESATTNYIQYSEDLAQLHNGPNMAIVSDCATAPDGTSTADLWYSPTSITLAHSDTVPAGVTTISFFAKAETGSVVSFNNTYSFNLLTGAITGLPGTATSVKFEARKDGWWYIAMEFAQPPSAINREIRKPDELGVYIWGAQIANGSYPSYVPKRRVFSTRPGPATYINSTGQVATAASNVARYTYDQNDLTKPPRLLLEPSGDNLLLQSADFSNAVWVKTTVTVLANNTTAPDGTLTAERLTGTAENSMVAQTITYPTGKAIFSVWLKGDVPCTIGLSITGVSTAAVTERFVEVGIAWKRFEVVCDQAYDASGNVCRIGSSGSIGPATIIYAWGAQYEVPPYVTPTNRPEIMFATSYIATTTVAATRIPDVSVIGEGNPRAADVNTAQVATNVSTGEYPAWDSNKLYVAGDRVQDNTTGVRAVYESAIGSTKPITIGIATNTAINWLGHGLATGTPISFTTTGALPTGMTAGQIYYVRTILDANSFTIVDTQGGSTNVATSGTQSGIHTARASLNRGVVPANYPAAWLKASSTNEWRMFDASPTSVSSATNVLAAEVTLKGRIDTVALVNTDAQTANLQIIDPTDGVVYNQTQQLVDHTGILDIFDYLYEEPVRKKNIFFEGIPPYSTAKVRMTLKSAGQLVTCGLMYIGSSIEIGYTQYGMKMGIQDFSVRDVDDFGNAFLNQRGYSPEEDLEVWVENSRLDYVNRLLASCRSTPVLYIGSNAFETSLIYGYYNTYSLTVQQVSVTLLNIELQGLA